MCGEYFIFSQAPASTESVVIPSDRSQVSAQSMSNPPIIVLIPGLDGATSFFDNVIPQLTPSFDLVVFRLPLRPTTMSEDQYTFDYICSRLHQVVEPIYMKNAGNDPSRGQPIHLVGESFGGVVAQWYTSLYPDHVSTLVLLSSLAKTDLPPAIAWKADNLLPILKGVGYVAPRLAQWIFARLHVDDVCEPSEPQFVKDLFIKEASRADFSSVMARISLVRHLDVVEKSKAIRKPTLIIHGADDHFTKESSFELHGLIQGSTLKSLAGGHLPHITSPKEFADMIRSHVLVTINVGGVGDGTAD